jgi:hypothetical protein
MTELSPRPRKVLPKTFHRLQLGGKYTKKSHAAGDQANGADALRKKKLTLHTRTVSTV